MRRLHAVDEDVDAIHSRMNRETLVAGDVPLVEGPTGKPAFGGRYEVICTLGRGGMGTVYHVRDLELDEEVALKVLHPSFAETKGGLDRFRREVKLARRVTHPNVARTFDLGAVDGTRFLTMELVHGESLALRLKRRPRFSLSDALRVVGEIAHGLAAAHAVGVVHRDLKPENVLIDTRAAAVRGTERVVITDFGIAVLSHEVNASGATVVGTPAYMAPEQVEGRDTDGRADVHALGAVLFELLSGRLPFEGKTPEEIADKRLAGEARDVRTVDPSVPEPVAVLVGEMLRRARERRPDILSVVRRIDELRGAAPARPPPNAPLVDPPPSRRRGEVTVVVAPFAAVDDDSRPLAVAVSDAVGDALSSLRGIRLVPAAAMRGPSGEARTAELARDATGTLVVHGAVTRGAERTRVRARLVDVNTGAQCWGQTFERGSAAEARLELEDELCGCLVEAVRTARQLSPPSTDVDGPEDPQARTLYEQGVLGAREFGDHLDQAIELLRKANGIAPKDPYIMSALGAALVRLWSFHEDPALLGEAEDWSLRALATGTRIGQTFNTIGILRLHQGDLVAAVDAFREAMARSPHLAEPYSYLGRLLSESGHVVEAEARLTKAVELDSGDHHALTELARIAAIRRDWERSEELLVRAAVGRVESVVLATRARFTVWRRDRARLGAIVEEMERRSEDPALRVVMRLLMPIWRALAGGQPLAADDPRLNALREAANGASMRLTMFWFQLLAEIHGVCGHADAALDAIEAAAAKTLIDVNWFDGCPALDGLRDRARLARARAVVATRAAALWG